LLRGTVGIEMELNKAERQLKWYLEQMRNLKRSTYPVNGEVYGVYYGMEDFLLQHGVWYRPVGIPPRQDAPNYCFGNALICSVAYGVPYIEGIGIGPRDLVPVHHAWNLDDQGDLADTTWMNTGLAYLGVEFSTGRASDALRFKNRVLDNPSDRHKIYKEPWQGENFNLIWRKWKPMRRLLKETQKSSRRDFRNRVLSGDQD
jgi:hypothetical protein